MPSFRLPARILAVHPGAEQYGSDRVFAEAVRGMLAAGSDVRVLVPYEGPLADELRGAGADVRVSELLVLRKSLMKPAGWAALVRLAFGDLRRVRRQIAEHRAALVYVSTVTLPLWSLLARRRSAVALHLHEAETSSGSLVRRVLAFPARAADVIVCNSRFTRDALLHSEPGLAVRTRVVLNPVPAPSLVVPPRAELDGVLRIGYLGRLSPRKGVDLLLQALPALVDAGLDARIDLVGAVFPGYEWYERELQESAARQGISERVRFVGFRSDIAPSLAEIDVLVVPSRLDEGFGNVAVEAVLARRPVIVSARAGLREAIAGVDTAIAVEPDDVPALVGALKQIAASWSEIVAATTDTQTQVAARHSVQVFRDALGGALADARDEAAPRIFPGFVPVSR
jgi:glycosyltransferase involved in cell wall biosynthesis